jgi:hypothetical protein
LRRLTRQTSDNVARVSNSSSCIPWNKAQGLRPLGLLALAFLLSLTPSLAQAQGVGSGDAYIAEVLAAMERRTNVSAKLRQQSRLGEQQLLGSGNFWQIGSGPQRTTRWEMNTSLDDQSAAYVQVFDGRYLWTDRNLPSGRHVHRLDVTNLKNRLRATVPQQAATTGWEQLTRDAEFRGGVSQLLSELLTRFHFDPPRSKQLNGFPVEALVGHWRPDQFAELCPIHNDDQPWPEQLPHHVLVLVSKNSLFPHVIEFRHANDASLAESENLGGLDLAPDPLVRYELFEVRFADAIDSTIFQFKPGDVDWSDETSLVYDKIIKQRGAAAAQLANRKTDDQTK